MTGAVIVFGILAIVVLIIIAKTAVVVPQQSAFVIERLGKYSGTLFAGFHVLVPFIDVIRYRHTLKEQSSDIPAQVCITRDNVQVGVDGILYLKVLNPERASYGIGDYHFAISQLAQTTLRSEIGKIDLDRTFEERTNINTAVVTELDKASESWGVKVLRYQIRNITPPGDILAAMEKQMRAEREKRAVILSSEGTRDAAINTAEGEKQQVIKASEARRQQQINEAQGQAEAILTVANATAEGLKKVGAAIMMEGGYDAVRLRVAEQYVAAVRAAGAGHHEPRAAGEHRRHRIHDRPGDERVQPAVRQGNAQALNPSWVRPGSDPSYFVARRARSQARRSRVAAAFRPCSASYHRTSFGPAALAATASAAAFATNLSRVANWNSTGSAPAFGRWRVGLSGASFLTISAFTASSRFGHSRNHSLNERVPAMKTSPFSLGASTPATSAPYIGPEVVPDIEHA